MVPRGAPTFSNGRQTVRGRQVIFTAARDPKATRRGLSRAVPSGLPPCAAGTTQVVRVLRAPMLQS